MQTNAINEGWKIPHLKNTSPLAKVSIIGTAEHIKSRLQRQKLEGLKLFSM